MSFVVDAVVVGVAFGSGVEDEVGFSVEEGGGVDVAEFFRAFAGSLGGVELSEGFEVGFGMFLGAGGEGFVEVRVDGEGAGDGGAADGGAEVFEVFGFVVDVESGEDDECGDEDGEACDGGADERLDAWGPQLPREV